MSTYPNKGKTWTREHDALVLRLKEEKAADATMEAALGRPMTAITARYRALIAAANTATAATADESATTEAPIRTFTVGYCKFVEC